MPLNHEYTKLWLDGPRPETFIERFEMQQHATELARIHLAKTKDMRRRTRATDVKHMIYALLHPLVHEWVKVLVYDPGTDRIIDPGRGRVVCRNCPPPR